MRPLSILVKPASGLCNMNCQYCFYTDEIQHREVALHGVMSEETLELLVRRAVEYEPTECNFTFQGGEPTLAGLDFYRRLLELETAYGKTGITFYAHSADQRNPVG